MKLLDRTSEHPVEPRGPQRYRATWNGAVIAEGTDTVVVEGNQYFEPADVHMDLLRPSATHTTCHWKGVASYYDVVVGDKINRDGAWYYPETSQLADPIRGRVAFWHGVKVEAVDVTTERG